MEEEKRKRKRGGDIDDIFGEGRKKSQEKQKAREKHDEEEKRRIEAEARAKDEMKVALGLQRKSKYKTDGIGANGKRRERNVHRRCTPARTRVDADRLRSTFGAHARRRSEDHQEKNRRRLPDLQRRRIAHEQRWEDSTLSLRLRLLLLTL